MGHDSSKVLLGMGRSSFRHVDNKIGAIPAGKVVRLKSDDTLSLAKADGEILGVSFGKDLSNAGRTNICRSGLLVPLILTAAFTPTKGAPVTVSDTTGLGIAAGAGATATRGVYASGLLTGIQEDGTEVPVALVDMQGGL